MVGSFYLIALATLPVYPGAVHKELAKVDRPEMKTYWVEQPTSVVVAWYERRLKRPAKRLKAEGFPTFSLALKERRLGFSGKPKSVLIKGVVVWGQEGGSTYIALVDRDVPSGPFPVPQGQGRLDYGPDAKVKKAVGADPDRYRGGALEGRSVQGRSVRGRLP